MTTTDDELLALARKATPGEWIEVPQNGAGPMIAHPYETGKQMNPRGLRLICHVLERRNSLEQDKANAAHIAAANPSAIIALIERHRAEVERLRADWDNHRNQISGLIVETYELRGEVGRLTAERDRLHEDRRALDIEIMRLTCERDADGASLYLKEKTIAHADARIQALESALSAAQKRIAELERALLQIEARETYDADELQDIARAALAGGTEGDGESVAQQQQVKP